MPSYRYDRLSAQDNTFLLGETPTAHMHISGVAIYELGDLATSEGGVDFPQLRRAVEAVLHRIPRYRQKLQWTPVTGSPVWVDDPDFNLDYHFRHTSLPRPGNLSQLKRLASRIMAQQLDRERPLWEMWVAEGLEGGRFALVTKIHHCMIDGSSGVDLAHILMSTQPEKEIPEPVRYVPRPVPSGRELLRDEMLRNASLPFRAVSSFRAFRRQTEDVSAEIGVRLRAIGELVGMAINPPSETPINGDLGPHRRFDWVSFPLAEVKEVRKKAGCTVNDVVLTTAAGAIRDYMKLRNVDPGQLDFRASAPVSVRSAEERGQMGNRVSSWMIRLPLEKETPLERLAAVHQTTQELKDSQQALGVDLMMRMADWTPPVLLSLGAQSAGGQVNTIITNVPGPQFPLYMLGAKLQRLIPMPPLLDQMGLAIALFSYDGELTWGFISDYNLVPDLPLFRGLVERSFAEFAEALGVKTSGPIDEEAT